MLLRDVAVFPETIFGPSRNNAPQENPGSFVRVSFHPQRRITGLTYTMTICTSNEPTRVRSCFECNNVSTAVRRHCIALGSCDGGIPGVQNDDVCCHEGARRPRLDLGSQGAGCFGAIDAMIVLDNCLTILSLLLLLFSARVATDRCMHAHPKKSNSCTCYVTPFFIHPYLRLERCRQQPKPAALFTQTAGTPQRNPREQQ